MPRGHLNVPALLAALRAEAKARDTSFRQLAKQVDISPSTLTRMGNGHRPDVDSFAALVLWLGLPAELFLVGDLPPGPQPALMAQLAPLLRARTDLQEADVSLLEDVIGATVRRFRTVPDNIQQDATGQHDARRADAERADAERAED